MQNLKHQIQIVTDKFAEKCNNAFGSNIATPIKIDYELCKKLPSCAGRASYNDMSISLNHIIMQDNVEQFLNGVIPHEVAHLVIRSLYGNTVEGHGTQWKSLMKKLGADPSTYHHMDISKAKEFKKGLKK